MKTIRSYLAVLLVLAGAAPASAQAVKIEFKDGLVNLSAQNASLRTILTEWTRQGGTRILNGERVTGTAITVEFTNAPERQVLESLLRSVPGYMLAPRNEGSTARSSFDSILIIPTSAPGPRPATAPPATTAFRPQPAPPPVVFDPNDPEENPLLGDNAPGDPNEDGPARGPRRVQRLPPGTPTSTPPGMPTPTSTPGMPTPMPMPVPGVRTNQPPPGVVTGIPQPDPEGAEPQEETPAPARPTNPFGVQPGSAQPGPGTPVAPRPNRNGPPNAGEEP